jgi:carbonic anhydrase/acetyltransferase-like protein (isoleucine patch superfamily)
VVYKASIENGVFIGTGAVVQGVDLVAHALVPPAVAVLSHKDVKVKKLVNTTSPADRKFSEKVVTANLALTKGYLNLIEQKLE